VALIENTLFGEKDKVKIAIERLQAFEPPEGYYLAFSGGKDSQCIYHLAKEAGVKFDAHYNLTTVDPPELVYFIRENYPDVIVDKPEMSMWRLIIKNNGPPTRMQRWCCRELKEQGGKDRICVTGVRWAESTRRKTNRAAFEVLGSKKRGNYLFNDNDEDRRMFENCMQKGKRIVNPIIDWEDADVWEYIHSRGLKYCKLYDEGFTRLGCIGCPMAGKNRINEFKRWPKYKAQYIRTFDKVVKNRKAKGMKWTWETGEDLMNWWLYGTEKKHELEGQIDLFEEVTPY
jgi:phosphoadenosine phosphosulfate reductase